MTKLENFVMYLLTSYEDGNNIAIGCGEDNSSWQLYILEKEYNKEKIEEVLSKDTNEMLADEGVNYKFKFTWEKLSDDVFNALVEDKIVKKDEKSRDVVKLTFSE